MNTGIKSLTISMKSPSQGYRGRGQRTPYIPCSFIIIVCNCIFICSCCRWSARSLSPECRFFNEYRWSKVRSLPQKVKRR